MTEEQIDLARQIANSDGVLDNVLHMYERTVEQAGMTFEEVYGDRSTLREALATAVAEVYTTHLDERLLRWQVQHLAQPEAREMRAKARAISEDVERATLAALHWTRALTFVKQCIRNEHSEDTRGVLDAARAEKSEDPEGDLARMILDKAESFGWQMEDIADRPGQVVRQVLTSMQRQGA